MSVLSKNNVVTINLILCSFLLFSCFKSLAKSPQKTEEYKTLPEIQHPSPKTPSLADKFAETRKKTEFLDDQTEKILNRNKKKIIIGLFVFMGLFIYNFVKYRKN